MFLDEAEIEVKAGDGGDGVVSLRHEKHVPRGGPDGGDGGRGGNVIAVADAHLRTLIDLTYRHRFAADDGGRGGANLRHGKNGADIEIRLPIGTVIRNSATGETLVDLVKRDQRVTLASGGRGGRGNAHYATPTRRTPRFAEKGEPGHGLKVRLELKLLADVGVIGLPNVGKSSLIAHVSAARPKIADYPFTTLVPNLGVVKVEEGVSFVIADMPGLVEGAHEGAGRGHQFLRHVERTRVLVHVIDITAPERDPLQDFRVINHELAMHDSDLAARPQLVALNKIDLRPDADEVKRIESALESEGYRVFRISALTGEGLRRLVGEASTLLRALPAPIPEVEPVEAATPRISALRVEQVEPGLFAVSGEKVELLVVMTDLDNEDAVRYLHRQLDRMGVIRKLRALGAKDGDKVEIGSVRLDFVE